MLRFRFSSQDDCQQQFSVKPHYKTLKTKMKESVQSPFVHLLKTFLASRVIFSLLIHLYSSFLSCFPYCCCQHGDLVLSLADPVMKT